MQLANASRFLRKSFTGTNFSTIGKLQSSWEQCILYRPVGFQKANLVHGPDERTLNSESRINDYDNKTGHQSLKHDGKGNKRRLIRETTEHYCKRHYRAKIVSALCTVISKFTSLYFTRTQERMCSYILYNFEKQKIEVYIIVLIIITHPIAFL
jgi:hypothetical protein